MQAENYGWYPGHMTKARRMMEENLKLVDLIIELCDARIPLSSMNPDIDVLATGKARILLFTKADLADDKATAAFMKRFEEQGTLCLTMDARTRAKNKEVLSLVKKACSERIERNRRRGIIGRPMRAMVAGIPNVGKSTFINSIMGRAAAKTGNKPGVTRGRQWVRLSADLELMDTPGITWPKFDDPDTAIRLALVGSIKEDIIHRQELCDYLLTFLRTHYEGTLAAKYGAEDIEGIARSKHLLAAGAEPDTERAQRLVLDDFKNGRLGRITLDLPPGDNR
ncbi:MAG: ribosome biogenesis GTPase YlqF [Lachnospiraceae bacterium]|nr:ribosome biogenesis GTPase YlqF [Lachnospiraceae bacterium]